MADKSFAFDLTDVKPADIEKFRNLAIANVIRPVVGGINESSMHDRHYSNHSKDKASSFLLQADELTNPAQLFGSIEGVKEISATEFKNRIK